MPGRGCLERAAQRFEDRDLVRLGDPRAALRLGKHQRPVALHLRPEAHHIRAPGTGIKRQIERQARLAAEPVPRLEGRHVGFGPCLEAVRVVALQIAGLARRVDGRVPILLGPLEELPQRLDARVGGLRGRRLLVAQLDDVLGFHQRIAEAADAIADRIEDAAPDLASAGAEPEKGGRTVIFLAQPQHRPGPRRGARCCRGRDLLQRI